VSTDQGELNSFNVSNDVFSGINKSPVERHNVIIVSRNEKIHAALRETLQNFFMNGKGIEIYSAHDLVEARSIAAQNPDIALVVIDDNIQVNGSYQIFVNFVRNELSNKNCCITFKEDLISTSNCSELPEQRKMDPEYEKFFYARERLIDITRMVMLTTEMESKIEFQQPIKTDILPEPDLMLVNSGQLAKDKLYTVLAHDLKGPVGNIKVMLDFLTNEPELLDKQTSKNLLSRVKESANNIHELLEDFLFWSRMLKRDIYYCPTKIDAEQLIQESILLLRSTAASKKISISAQLPSNTWIFADEYMITTALRNLIYNAIKFTDEEGTILLTGNLSNNFLEIQVTDTGIGIAKDSLDKIFRTDVYFSTKGTAKETGTGLGLILCKDFIEKNGGQISVESTPNIGSTFTITIPRAKEVA
jgi:signal transduction histidine kinase